jgi:transportin-3
MTSQRNSPSQVRYGTSHVDVLSLFSLLDTIELLKIIIQRVTPYVPANQTNPAITYCQEIIPILAELAQRFHDFTPILERVCSVWRHMVLSYRTAAAPILPSLAENLVAGFGATKQGCFLWATDAIVREFSEHAEDLDPSITMSVVPFYEQQATAFLYALSEVSGDHLPDLIEDFFRLTIDMLQHHTSRAFTSPLMSDIFAAACHALSLLKLEVLMTTLHFLRDFISYGSPNPASSRLSDDRPLANESDIIEKVKGLLLQHGENLTQRVLTGMMYSFPEDCIPDASGVVLDMLRVLPDQTGAWIAATLVQLPQGAIRPQEREKLVGQIEQ